MCKLLYDLHTCMWPDDDCLYKNFDRAFWPGTSNNIMNTVIPNFEINLPDERRFWDLHKTNRGTFGLQHYAKNEQMAIKIELCDTMKELLANTNRTDSKVVRNERIASVKRQWTNTCRPALVAAHSRRNYKEMAKRNTIYCTHEYKPGTRSDRLRKGGFLE